MPTENIKIESTINLQPYFNQVVASNLVIAFFAAKQTILDKSEDEIFVMVKQMWFDLYNQLEEIPTKPLSQK